MATVNGSETQTTDDESTQGTLFGHPLPSNWRDLIGPDRNRPGEDRGRVLEPGIPVWAIVGHLRALGDEFTPESVQQAALDFKIPVTRVTAALAYYVEHREAVDARLTINASAVA